MEEMLLGDSDLGGTVTQIQFLYVHMLMVPQGTHSGCLQNGQENARDQGEGKSSGSVRPRQKSPGSDLGSQPEVKGPFCG